MDPFFSTPYNDTCRIEAYARVNGKERKIIFPRAQIVWPLIEGDQPGTTILSLEGKNNIHITVNMEIEALNAAIANQNIKAGTHKGANLIDLTAVTKAVAPAKGTDSIVHVEGNLYAAPEDAKDGNGNRLALTFNQAADYAKKMNAENYLGYSDWRVPTDNELKTLIKNKNKDGLKGTFDESSGTTAEWYWSSSTGGGDDACIRQPRDGDDDWNSRSFQLSARLVRSSTI